MQSIANGWLSRVTLTGRQGRSIRRLLARAAMGVSAASVLGLSLAGLAASAQAEPLRASNVSASYRISFNGFDIGGFRFDSQANKRGQYTLSASAKLSALLGAFTWRGGSRSSGELSGSGPDPASYDFDFKSNSKRGAVQIRFDRQRISQVKLQPHKDPHPEAVVVKDEHLRNVLDPLSAVLALTLRSDGNPCNRRLPIYDGKQRFDLVFTFRRQQRVAEQLPSGQPRFAFVCHVRYVPISGHRMNKETRFMAGNDGMEVALRPVPSANLLVPVQVKLPTIAGSAIVALERMDITTPGNKRIALVH